MNVAFKNPASPVRSLDAIAEALLLPTGIDGVHVRTAAFENVVAALAALISRHREPGTEVLHFPPVMSRRQLEKSGYLKSFPNFLGCVCCLGGTEAEIGGAVERLDAGEDWTNALSAADLVLSPAACYPVYPLVASRGEVPAEGLLFDVAGDCFRREPSKDLDRLQSFRMREYVCLGTPAQVDAFRQRWIKWAPEFAGRLGLPFRIEQASDPFFGRGGKLMAMSQRRAGAEIRTADSGAVGGGSDGVHELQLSSRPFRHGVEFARCRRRSGSYRLRRVRHGPAGARHVRHAWCRAVAVAVVGAKRAGDLTSNASRPGLPVCGGRGRLRAATRPASPARCKRDRRGADAADP